METREMPGWNYLNRPTETKTSFALEVLIHPERFDDSDIQEAIAVAVNALRYVLHEIKSK